MADGRFAPSPTGTLHLGNLRTALVAWLFARSAGSRFLLRVEDHDPVAGHREIEARQLADLERLGLSWDGEIVHTSERADRYNAVLEGLRSAGLTYPCYCSRREIRLATHAPNGPVAWAPYPGTCRHLSAAQRTEREAGGRTGALRLRSGEPTVSFVDRIHGSCSGPVDDFVLQRNDGAPGYNLTVVVDDADQGVEEVVRGDDLLDSTPRHLHLAGLLGLPEPTHAHIPLVLGPSGDRLAKRDGAVTLDDRQELGESADDVRALLAASLGLTEPGEPAPLDLILSRFDPDKLPTAPWIMDSEPKIN